MSKQADHWALLLEREDVIGGQLEVLRHDGVVHRGPVKAVVDKGDRIEFVLAWVAQYDPYINPRWTHAPQANTTVWVRRDVTPLDRDDGSVQFEIPTKGQATFFPQGCGRMVSARNVEGLKL